MFKVEQTSQNFGKDTKAFQLSGTYFDIPLDGFLVFRHTDRREPEISVDKISGKIKNVLSVLGGYIECSKPHERERLAGIITQVLNVPGWSFEAHTKEPAHATA